MEFVFYLVIFTLSSLWISYRSFKAGHAVGFEEMRIVAVTSLMKLQADLPMQEEALLQQAEHEAAAKSFEEQQWTSVLEEADRDE